MKKTASAYGSSFAPSAGNAGRGRAGFTDRRPEASAQVRQLRMMQANTPVVQRYEKVTSMDYKLEHDEDEVRAPFTVQDPQPQLVNIGDHISPSSEYTWQTLEHDATPDLTASDDHTVALNSVPEPKEFYGTAQVLQHANTALAAKQSKYRLVTKGNRIHMHGHTLSMAEPVINGTEVQQGALDFANFLTSVCRNMAATVMNSDPSSHEGIFQQAIGRGIANPLAPQKRRMINTGHGEHSQSMQNIAGALTERDAPQALEHAFRQDVQLNDPQTGEDYGNALREGKLGERAQEAGINEYAAPEVGEGFTTYTTPGGKNQNGNLDHSAQAPPLERTNIWGYHFAGVVAASEDGKDRVTLENYNRSEDMAKVLRPVYDHLLEQYGKEISEAMEEMRLGEDTPFRGLFQIAYTVAHMMQSLTESEQEKRSEARQAYLAFMSRENDGKAWFFQLYGSNPKQTFHERQAASGFFANPMTMRVGQIPQPLDNLRATLSGRLDNIPQPVPLVAGSIHVDASLQNIKRQMAARTRAQDVKDVFNDGLRSLIDAYKFAHIYNAQLIGQKEGIEPGDPRADTEPARIYNAVLAIHRETSSLRFIRISELQDRLDSLLAIYHKVQQLNQYLNGNLEP